MKLRILALLAALMMGMASPVF
ncbi:MAG: hypothetical protein RIS83_2296, partial [Pseudomonadota bacterium]